MHPEKMITMGSLRYAIRTNKDNIKVVDAILNKISYSERNLLHAYRRPTGFKI